jgi:hypothetical protein
MFTILEIGVVKMINICFEHLIFVPYVSPLAHHTFLFLSLGRTYSVSSIPDEYFKSSALCHNFKESLSN